MVADRWAIGRGGRRFPIGARRWPGANAAAREKPAETIRNPKMGGSRGVPPRDSKEMRMPAIHRAKRNVSRRSLENRLRMAMFWRMDREIIHRGEESTWLKW